MPRGRKPKAEAQEPELDIDPALNEPEDDMLDEFPGDDTINSIDLQSDLDSFSGFDEESSDEQANDPANTVEDSDDEQDDDTEGPTGDALIDAIDNMLANPKPETEDDKEPPFINCKEFKLIGISLNKNRRFSVVASADGALVSDTISQAHAIGETDLQKSVNLVCRELVSKLFPNNPEAIVSKLHVKTKQNKKKDPEVVVSADADDDTGITTVGLKAKPVQVNALGTPFSVHFKGLELEVLHILRESRSSGGVQKDLFGNDKVVH